MSQEGTPKVLTLEGWSSHRSSIDGGASTRFPSIRTSRYDQLDSSPGLKSTSTPRLTTDINLKSRRASLALDQKTLSSLATPKIDTVIAQSFASTILKLPEMTINSPSPLTNQRKKSESPRKTESPRKNDAIAKNEAVGRIVKETMKKKRYHSESHADKFENKLKIFKGVSTFINVKDTIQNLNVLNQIETVDEEAAERNVRKRLAEAAKTNKLSNLRSNPRIQDPSMAQFDSVLDQAKKIMSSSVNNKKRTSQSRELPHRAMRQVTNVLLKDRRKNYDSNDRNDLDFFYDSLEKDFITGRYEKPEYLDVDFADSNAITSDLDYLRMLLEEKTKLSMARDKNYHQNFKKRAENVISVLKKTAKKIFDRKENHRFILKADTDRAKQMTQEDRARKEEQMKQRTEVLSFLENKMDEFATINTLPVERQLELLKSRVNNLVNFDPASVSQAPARATITRRRKEIFNPLTMSPETKNREINAVHKKYAEVLITELGNQVKTVHEMKEVMNRQIEQLEGLYQQDLDKMTEDPFEAIRVDVGTKGHFGSFGNKKVGGGLTAKTLAKVLGN